MNTKTCGFCDSEIVQDIDKGERCGDCGISLCFDCAQAIGKCVECVSGGYYD